MSLPGTVVSKNYNGRVERCAGKPVNVYKYLAQYVVHGRERTARMAPGSVLSYNNENALKEVMNESTEI